MTVRIICGNNLNILPDIADDSIDLIYADPPFFTEQDYEVIWNDGEELRQFGDRWITEHKDGSGKATKDLNVYLDWMRPRIEQMYRVLKPTGSFYLQGYQYYRY
jgi:DNA modification methylase